MAVTLVNKVAGVTIPVTYNGGIVANLGRAGFSVLNNTDSSTLSLNEEAAFIRYSFTAYQLRLISAWEFDEVAGARADSRAANHLTDNNTVASGTGVATNDSKAAVFVAGNLEYLSRAAGTQIGIDNKSGDFSVEIAFTLSALGVTQTLIGRGATSNTIKGFWCFINTSNRFQITLGNGTSRVSVNPTNVLTTATLYHIICTCDRDGNMSVYINNSLGSGTGAASIAGITGDLGNVYEFLIGQVAAVTHLSGSIGFVRMWDGLLDSTDRTYLYNSGNLRSFAQL